MNLTLSHTFLFVDDQDAALTFYRDVLGLEVRSDHTFDDEFDNMRWLTVGPAGQPELEINLYAGSALVSAEDNRVLQDLTAKGAMPGVIFLTDDLDATFDRVRAAGAEVLQEPTEQVYGVRDCAFRDPAGNMVRFSARARD
ncbi:VOC family protein [Actinoalloteichus spitiensis]|uniref:VOC family protein n=1 Tax=Actinoalloteichus spitiensis TaxID=252394 RepID=UPI0003735645|nr:VOC family protein [Actinoalloteichus spitiensis]